MLVDPCDEMKQRPNASPDHTSKNYQHGRRSCCWKIWRSSDGPNSNKCSAYNYKEASPPNDLRHPRLAYGSSPKNPINRIDDGYYVKNVIDCHWHLVWKIRYPFFWFLVCRRFKAWARVGEEMASGVWDSLVFAFKWSSVAQPCSITP